MNDKIVIGYIHSNNVHVEFMHSLLNTIVWDLSRGILHFNNGGGWTHRFSGPNVSNSRNEIVAYFLDKTQADWLMMIDTDIIFQPEAIHTLWKSATETSGCTVMSGLYWGIRSEEHMQGVLPVAVNFPDGPGHGAYPIAKLDRFPITVEGVGAGFMLVHRSALAAVRKANYSAAFPWFQETEYNGEVFSEDLEFCQRLTNCGHTVWMNAAVEVAHMKEIPLHSRVILQPLLKAVPWNIDVEVSK